MTTLTRKYAHAAAALILAVMAFAATPAAASTPPTPALITSVRTPADGADGEFGLAYTVNMSDGTSQAQVLNGAGNFQTAMAPGVTVSSVNVNGQVLVPGGRIIVRVNAGCWVFCLRCDFWLWPPIVRCRLIIYYDPCC